MTVESFQQVHFVTESTQARCPIAVGGISHSHMPQQVWNTRLHQLLHQNSWVASDEIKFYMRQMATVAHVGIVTPLLVSPAASYCQITQETAWSVD